MNKITNLDPNQIVQRTYDEENNAQRFILVGSGLPETIRSIASPVQNLTTIDVKEIHIPEIIREVQTIEVPIIIREVEIKEVQVPVIVKEIEIKTIEVPVIVKEIEIKEVIRESKPETIVVNNKNNSELTQFAKMVMIIQTISLIGLFLSNVFKH